jgi:cupin fold WbuC family metalloprotein
VTDVETIRDGPRVLAIVVRAARAPAATEFVTPDSYKQQVGFIVYPRGGAVRPHFHRELARQIEGMSEVLLVRSGRTRATLYREDGAAVAERELGPGDLIVLVAGGHGFTMLEDTVLLEIKQGPYAGPAEKVYLDRP